MKEIHISSALENLAIVLDFIGQELDSHGCNTQLHTRINIAVEEIFVNISNYAYTPEIGEVVVKLRVSDGIEIFFEDAGTPYNPVEAIDPDTTKNADERELGGLGIFMVKKIMDSVEYKYEDNKNKLSIRKKF